MTKTKHKRRSEGSGASQEGPAPSVPSTSSTDTASQPESDTMYKEAQERANKEAAAQAAAIAKQAEKDGDIKEAVKMYDKAVTLDPSTKEYVAAFKAALQKQVRAEFEDQMMKTTKDLFRKAHERKKQEEQEKQDGKQAEPTTSNEAAPKQQQQQPSQAKQPSSSRPAPKKQKNDAGAGDKPTRPPHGTAAKYINGKPYDPKKNRNGIYVFGVRLRIIIIVLSSFMTVAALAALLYLQSTTINEAPSPSSTIHKIMRALWLLIWQPTFLTSLAGIFLSLLFGYHVFALISQILISVEELGVKGQVVQRVCLCCGADLPTPWPVEVALRLRLFAQFPFHVVFHAWAMGGGWAAMFMSTFPAYILFIILLTPPREGDKVALIMYALCWLAALCIPHKNPYSVLGALKYIVFNSLWILLMVPKVMFWSPPAWMASLSALFTAFYVYRVQYKGLRSVGDAFELMQSIDTDCYMVPFAIWAVGGRWTALFGTLLWIPSSILLISGSQSQHLKVFGSMLTHYGGVYAIVALCHSSWLLWGVVAAGLVTILLSPARPNDKVWLLLLYIGPVMFTLALLELIQFKVRYGWNEPWEGSTSHNRAGFHTFAAALDPRNNPPPGFGAGSDLPIPPMMDPLPVPSNAPGAVADILRSTNHYEVLGLQWGAGEGEVRKAKRALSLATHPDKAAGVPGAPAACARVLEAADVLLDPGKREEYESEMAMLRFRLYGHASDAVNEAVDAVYEETGIDLTMKDFVLFGCDHCQQGQHQLPLTPLPATAARQCDECRTRHPVREGEMWLERKTSMLGVYTELKAYVCRDGKVYDASTLFNCMGLFQTVARSSVTLNTHDNLFKRFSGEEHVQSPKGGGRRKKGGKRRK